MLLVIAVFVAMTVLGAYIGALEWDEGSFLLNAEYVHGTDENLEESRPATISYLVAVLWTVTGESTFAARMLIILFGVGVITLFYRIVAQEFDDPLPVTTVFAFTPLLLYWSFHVYTDVPSLFVVLTSYYLYRQERHLFAGIVIAAAATIRYVFVVFAVGMGIAYLFQHRTALHRYMVGGIIGALPFFTYGTLLYGHPLSKVQMYVTRVSQWSDSTLFAATIPSASAALVTLGPLLPVIHTGWRKTPFVEKSMIAVYTGFFLFISGNSFYRYWLPVVPFLLLIAYRGLQDRRHLFAIVAVTMIVVSGVAVGTNYAALQTCSGPMQEAIQYVDGRDGSVVSDDWAVTGYLLDRPVYSPFTDYTTLRDDYGVRYVITADTLPYREAAQFSNRCRAYTVYDITDRSDST